MKVADRIKSAGEYLGVSMGELVEEVSRIYECKDSKEMQELFQAYELWELRDTCGGLSLEEKMRRTMGNMEMICAIADKYTTVVRDVNAAVICMLLEDRTYSGPINDSLGVQSTTKI